MRNRISRNELPEKRLLLFFVIIFLVWFCWKPYFLSFFNDYIIRYLDIRTSSLTDALFIVISLSILVAIIMGIRRRYTTSYAHISRYYRWSLFIFQPGAQMVIPPRRIGSDLWVTAIYSLD